MLRGKSSSQTLHYHKQLSLSHILRRLDVLQSAHHWIMFLYTYIETICDIIRNFITFSQ